MLPGMPKIYLLLFHGSSEDWNDVFIDGQVGVSTTKVMYEGYGDEGRTRTCIELKAQESGSLYDTFFCKGITQNVSFAFH